MIVKFFLDTDDISTYHFAPLPLFCGVKTGLLSHYSMLRKIGKNEG